MAGQNPARKARTVCRRTALDAVWARYSAWGWRAAVIGSLMAPPAAWAEGNTASDAVAETTVEVKVDEVKVDGESFVEDSVLIVTRKVEEAESAASTALQPISSHSEQEPELADPPATKTTAKPAAADTQVVAKPAPAKEAAKPAPTQPQEAASAPATEEVVTVEEEAPAPEAKVAEAAVEESAPAAPAEPSIVKSEAKPAPKQETPAEETPADETPVVAVEEPSTEVTEEVAVESKPETIKSPRIAMKDLPADPSDDVGDAYASQPSLQAARFHGVVPGVTTLDELTGNWGVPKSSTAAKVGQVLRYDLSPFKAVDVLVEGEVVTLIRVQLDTQQQPERLARRLRLDAIESVEVFDDSGETVVGLAYPEKGILLMLAQLSAAAPPETPQFVTHMVIQELDAEAFALRADQAPYEAFEKKLADLKTALMINPDDAYTNWRLAELHRLTASPDKALVAAEAALKADPQSTAYRLCLAQCLADQGKFDEAVLESRKVLDSDDAPAVVKAGALQLMGRLASKGESAIASKAIGFHTMAIDVADTLATSVDSRERHTAKRILIESHLAVASEIARRKYARKMEIVAQWIARASGLAEQMIETDNGSLELRLIVAREALATLASLKPTKDPAPFIKEAETTASQLLADSDDALFRSRVQWKLGEAYFHALRVEHTRQNADSGIEYGERAIRNLQASAVVGDLRPEAEMLVGRLYFHIGAAYAVHKQNHEEAVDWYEKAYPLMTSGGPKSELLVPRRKGEALVSMAVSYWTVGQRDRGLELTDDGSQLMEAAVAAGVLEESALTVPYGNLSKMHKRLGNRSQSIEFAKLARGARGAAETFAEAIENASPEETATGTPKQASSPRRNPVPPRSAAKPRTETIAKSTPAKQSPSKQGQASGNRVASRPSTSKQTTSTPSPSKQSTAKKPSSASKSNAQRVPSAAEGTVNTEGSKSGSKSRRAVKRGGWWSRR